ncbi:uncharacterized protein LOC114320411 [Camellia sinensis]|uniref:uncharacterized protein LOC114320411 n=1 Tax=Camellia sinensis TaxID=4442 RepID=UPI0010366870|nr:uncharacterized protein LOC114320411 [Camellia sinensis]
MSKRVAFSPDVNNNKHGGSAGIKVGGKKRRVVGIWIFRASKHSNFSPVGFLRRIGATVLRFVSSRKRSSRKVSSSSLSRSRSCAETVDSHRAEAIEDCIEFLNSSSSSSSLQRSYSVSASSC